MTAAQLVQPLANGARVLSLDTDFDGCMAIVQRLAEEEGRLPRELDEQPAARRAEDVVDRDRRSSSTGRCRTWSSFPAATSGNVSAIGAGFDMMVELGRHLEAAAHRRRAGGGGQPALSRVSEQLAVRAGDGAADALRRRSRSAIPCRCNKAIRTLQRFNGIVEQATESELADAAARADRTGMFNCPHTGVALAALEKLVARGEIAGTDRDDRDLDGATG